MPILEFFIVIFKVELNSFGLKDWKASINTFPFLKAMNGLSINSIDRIISFKVFSLLSNRLLSLPSSVSLL